MGSIFSVLNLIHLVEKYQSLIEKVLATFAQLKGTQPGETVTIPEIKATIEGESWVIPAHPATRER